MWITCCGLHVVDYMMWVIWCGLHGVGYMVWVTTRAPDESVYRAQRKRKICESALVKGGGRSARLLPVRVIAPFFARSTLRDLD